MGSMISGSYGRANLSLAIQMVKAVGITSVPMAQLLNGIYAVTGWIAATIGGGKPHARTGNAQVKANFPTRPKPDATTLSADARCSSALRQAWLFALRSSLAPLQNTSMITRIRRPALQ